MTRTGEAARPDLAFEDRTASAAEWARTHGRQLATGVAVLAVVGLGVYAYEKSVEKKAAAGEQALYEAQRSVYGGDLPRAQTALQKVTTQYSGTPAGTQATIVLAQVLYDQGKYADGVRELEKSAGSVDRVFRPGVEALLAAGYEGEQKFADAAQHYLKAADAAEFDLDKQKYRADAARTFMRAGNAAEATKLWSALADDPASPLAGEARIRLGELLAKPASRG
jgi:predicted negative regulator of RcsB-dependent stress response